MLKDSRSYEVQIIDAVRSVNRALGGTYGTSSAIYKSEFNQYEVQLIDAIKGIGRTLSGKGLSISGGLGGASAEALEDLAKRVTKLESESFFRLVDGNVTLKEQYSNLWVPGWLAAGGVGSSGGGGGGGSVEHLSDIGDVTISTATLADGQGIVWDATDQVWRNATIGGGGGGSTVYWGTPSGNSVPLTVDGTTKSLLTSYTETDPTVPSWAKATNPSLYVGTTRVQTSSGAQDLTGILSVKATSANASKMEWDSSNNAWHFYGNVYAEGWIAAGGIGSGGGGGGGATFLGDLSDVTLSSPSNGQALVYRNGIWQNETIQGGGGSTVSWGSSGSDYVYLSVNGTSKKLLTEHQDLSGYVTLSTPQSIDGAKTFTTNPVTIADDSGISVDADSYIDIGDARLVYDSGSNALHITRRTGGTNNVVGLFADGFVASGGVSGQSTFSYVTLDSNQTIGGNKTFSGTTQLGQTMIGTISILGSGTAPYINNILDRIYIQRAGQTGVSMCATAGQVVIGALNTTNTSKLFVNGNAAFTYATGSTISISEIVSRIEALENA